MKRTLVILGLLAYAQAAAQLVDPTQPPASITQPVPPAGEGHPAAPAGPVLQSVLISPHRQVAVIDGETIKLGGSFKGAILAKVTETEVVLMRGGQKEVLRLNPAEEKKAASAVQRKHQ